MTRGDGMCHGTATVRPHGWCMQEAQNAKRREELESERRAYAEKAEALEVRGAENRAAVFAVSVRVRVVL